MKTGAVHEKRRKIIMRSDEIMYGPILAHNDFLLLTFQKYHYWFKIGLNGGSKKRTIHLLQNRTTLFVDNSKRGHSVRSK